MKKRGPLLTIAAVAILGLILIAIAVFDKPEDTTARTSTPPGTSTAGTGTPPPSGPPTSSADRTAATLFPPNADFVGTLPPTSANTTTLSVTVEGANVIAYACDGATTETWLSGTITDGKIDITGKNNSRMTGTLNGDDLVGEIELGDEQWDYTAGKVQAPAGLYVAEQNGEKVAWIVDAAGSVTGVRRLPDGTFRPAPDLPMKDGKVTDPSVTKVVGPADVS